MRSERIGEIGKRIKLARESLLPAPMKQTDLAARLQVSQARLSNWERGEHDPQLEHVMMAAKVLGVSLDWLMGDDVPMKQTPQSVAVFRTGLRFIPVKGAIAAGSPSSSVADVDWIEVKDWGGDLERWGRVIEGFSMTSDLRHPDDLQPGDVAVFENRRAELGHVVQAFDDGRGRARRGEVTGPAGVVEIRVALLGDGGDVGQQRRAPGAGHEERLDAAIGHACICGGLWLHRFFAVQRTPANSPASSQRCAR